ncbi:MAG: hypothetical protein K2Y32_17000 [Candidatus Obscuribacterales bacterium]|nr:hypothetical protein [Candidatus Obscuribacterales bacterium]
MNFTLKAGCVAFCDVDDSLISNSRTAPCAQSEPCAFDDKGAVCGYVTPRQKALNKLLSQGAVIVPTTARSSKGLAGVQFAFPVAYSIVSFGGLILCPDGEPEPRFYAMIKQGAERYKGVLEDLLALVQREAESRGICLRSRVVVDCGLPLYLSVKHNDKSRPGYKEELALIRNLAAEYIAVMAPEFAIHLNGNFLAVLPPFLRKEYAVRWFLENIAPGVMSIGFGDSVTDLDFAAECDYVLMPSVSQAFEHLTAA